MTKKVKVSPLATFESWARDMPRAELGGLIKEYVAESNYWGWDGFNSRDLTGISRFLLDLMRYHKHGAEDPGGSFATRTDNLNPVP
jgi:hypothetical protein